MMTHQSHTNEKIPTKKLLKLTIFPFSTTYTPHHILLYIYLFDSYPIVYWHSTPCLTLCWYVATAQLSRSDIVYRGYHIYTIYIHMDPTDISFMVDISFAAVLSNTQHFGVRLLIWYPTKWRSSISFWSANVDFRIVQNFGYKIFRRRDEICFGSRKWTCISSVQRDKSTQLYNQRASVSLHLKWLLVKVSHCDKLTCLQNA